jgi:hypothetical protein
MKKFLGRLGSKLNDSLGSSEGKPDSPKIKPRQLENFALVLQEDGGSIAPSRAIVQGQANSPKLNGLGQNLSPVGAIPALQGLTKNAYSPKTILNQSEANIEKKKILPGIGSPLEAIDPEKDKSGGVSPAKLACKIPLNLSQENRKPRPP